MEQREIKFRAWDKVLCIMIEEHEMTGKREFGNGRNTLSSILDNPDYDVMFSIGKNKDGIHIFTKDIVKGKGFRGNKEIIITPNGYMLKHFNPHFFTNSMLSHFQVIGNIHQDKHLLI